MIYLKQSTAIPVLVGPLVDATDGVTAETALDVTALTVRLYKYTESDPISTITTITPSAAASGTNYMVHLYDGYYSLALTAANVNTNGSLSLAITSSAICPVRHDFTVMSTGSYGAFILANAQFRANVMQWNSATIATPDTAGYPVVTIKDGTGQGEIATTSGAIDSVLSAGLSASAIDNIWDEAQSGHTTAGTFGRYLDAQVSSISTTSSGNLVSAIADAVWDEAQSGHTSAGSFGQYVDAQISTVDSVADTIDANVDILIGRTAASNVTVVSPVISDSEAVVYLGTDYASALGNALEFSSTNWTDLTSGSITVHYLDGTQFTTGTVVTASASGTQTIRIELTQANLTTLGRGRHVFLVKGTVSGQSQALIDMVLHVR